MSKIQLEVIQTEEIPIWKIPVEKRPPVKLELLKGDKNITVKIPQEFIGEFYTIEDNKTELHLKGTEKPIIVKGSAQDIITRFCTKKQCRELKRAERIHVKMPEEVIGSLAAITVQTVDGQFEEATKLFQKGTEQYIIVSGSVMDNLKKLCPTLNFS